MNREQIERSRKAAIDEIDEDSRYVRKLETAMACVMNADSHSSIVNLIEDMIEIMLRRITRRYRGINSYDETLKSKDDADNS